VPSSDRNTLLRMTIALRAMRARILAFGTPRTGSNAATNAASLPAKAGNPVTTILCEKHCGAIAPSRRTGSPAFAGDNAEVCD
jgi:hypothetical protein